LSFIFAAVVVLLFIGIKPQISMRDDYISLKQTHAINGFFIILVFLRHFNQYVELQNPCDKLFLNANELLGQLIVTTFMFYSGYGVVISILKKGKDYLKNIPFQRILKTMVLFDIAILFYVLTNIILHIHQTVPQVLLSFIGWEGVGNSTWYIFAILVMYLITYVSFMASDLFRIKHNDIVKCMIATCLVGAYILVIKRFKDSQYYNTVMCYAMGMWFAVLQKYIDKLMKNNKLYVLALIGCTALFAFAAVFRESNLLINQLYYLVFVAVVVLITMRVRFGNPVLDWCGSTLLGLYILQRLPMLVIQRQFVGMNVYLFFALSLVISLVMTWLYSKYVMSAVNKVFKKKPPVATGG